MGRHKSKPADAGAAVLGGRVRQLRKARGLTLKELGSATGLSHAFLSQLERGRARPSMSSLDEIAAALGISAATLVSHTPSGVVRHVRHRDAPVVHTGLERNPFTVRALTSEDALMKVTEIAGGFPSSERMAHPGEEVVYVIDGRIEVEIDGEIFLLDAGDVLNFDCSIEHTYRVVGDAPARFLVIAADPGQYASPVDENVYESRVANGNAGARANEARDGESSV